MRSFKDFKEIQREIAKLIISGKFNQVINDRIFDESLINNERSKYILQLKQNTISPLFKDMYKNPLMKIGVTKESIEDNKEFNLDPILEEIETATLGVRDELDIDNMGLSKEFYSELSTFEFIDCTLFGKFNQNETIYFTVLSLFNQKTEDTDVYAITLVYQLDSYENFYFTIEL